MIRNVLCVVDALDESESVPQAFLGVLEYYIQLCGATLHVFYAEPDEFLLPSRDRSAISDDVVETAKKYGFPYIDLSQTLLVPALIELLGEGFVRTHSMLPLFLRGNSLYVATTDPIMLLTLTGRTHNSKVAMLPLKYRALPIVADGGLIERAIDYMFDHKGSENARVEKALKRRFAPLDDISEIKIIVRRGNLAKKLLSAIEEYHIDLIAMPNKGRHDDQVLLNVMRTTTSQLLVVPLP